MFVVSQNQPQTMCKISTQKLYRKPLTMQLKKYENKHLNRKKKNLFLKKNDWENDKKKYAGLRSPKK